MGDGKWREVIWVSLRIVAVAIISVLHRSSLPLPWRIYAFRDGSFDLASSFPAPSSPPRLVSLSPPPSLLPDTWDVTASALADVTGDGVSEWVLVVWRPWRDWPIQRWTEVPSPIAGFHDAAGDSCHLILLDPHDGREIWAGSALPAPFTSLAVGDVDGDGRSEVVTLEGDYGIGRSGSATRVDVWQWSGFGFTMAWRSSPGTFRELRLVDGDGDGTLDIAMR
jgi:hypothetical protein